MLNITLLDTNAIIDLFNEQLEDDTQTKLRKLIGNGFASISIITRLEVLSGLHKEANPDAFKIMLDSVRMLNIVPELEPIIVHIRRETSFKLPDAIIAATALFLDAQLITSDRRGFGRVQGLDIWVPERRP